MDNTEGRMKVFRWQSIFANLFTSVNIRKPLTLLVTLSLLQFTTTVYSQESSLILFDHGSYGLNFAKLNDIKWQFDRHYQVYVGSESDVSILRNVLIETSVLAEEELTEVQVRVLRYGGPDTTFTLASFTPQPFDAETMDHLLQLEDLLAGDTIDVKYKIQSDPSTNTQRWTLQYDFPVRESTVTYIVPKVFSYSSSIPDKSYLIKQSTVDSTLRLSRGRVELKGITNRFANIPAYRDEPFAPQPIVAKPTVLFTLTDYSLGESAAYLPSWSEQFIDLAVSEIFGKQYRTRSNYRWLVEEASDLFKKKYSDRLMILLLYQFIHKQLTWDGSYGLIPSVGVNEMRFEKIVNKAGMNMALLALLQEADFNAYPILVATSDQPMVFKEIEDINQFNHFVIEVNLGREKIYLDAGQEVLPVGWIDSGIRGQPAVRIQNLRGQWTEVPEFSGSSTIVVNLDVAADFSAQGTIHASFTGYDAFNERLRLKEDQQAQYWKDRASSLSRALRIDSVRFENVTNTMEPFENKVFFHLPGSADSEELQLNPVFYSFFGNSFFSDSVRQNDIEFPFSIAEQIVLNINLASGLNAQMSPSVKLALEDDGGSLDFLTSENDRSLQSSFKAILSRTSFSPIEYQGLRKFLDATYQLTQQPIIIRKS